jgi:hypothetical protein
MRLAQQQKAFLAKLEQLRQVHNQQVAAAIREAQVCLGVDIEDAWSTHACYASTPTASYKEPCCAGQPMQLCL